MINSREGKRLFSHAFLYLVSGVFVLIRNDDPYLPRCIRQRIERDLTRRCDVKISHDTLICNDNLIHKCNFTVVKIIIVRILIDILLRQNN